MSEELEVTILGTSGGIPIEGRAQSGVLVESKDTKVLFDCGMAVPLRLKEAGVDAEEIDYIFLTHQHLDHIQDLPSLTKAAWLRNNQEKVDYTIICPKDMTDWLPGLWKSSGEFERVELNIKGIKSGVPGYYDGIKVEAFETPHVEESLGYVLDDGKVIYTGDSAPNENILDLIDNTELLIHELSLNQKSDLHTDPEGIIKVLSRSGSDEVDHLLLTHFYPEVIKKLNDIQKMIENKTGIQTRMSKDLDRYTINISDK